MATNTISNSRDSTHEVDESNMNFDCAVCLSFLNYD